MDASTAPTVKTAATATAPSPSPSYPPFYVATAWRMGRTGASLEPGTAGVAVPAMARHVPETFEGLIMEAHRDL